MSIRVRMTEEERILNALARVPRKRTDSVLTRNKKEFDTIRPIIQPLRDRIEELEAVLSEVVEALLQIQWETNPDRMRTTDHVPDEERIHTTALQAIAQLREFTATKGGTDDDE